MQIFKPLFVFFVVSIALTFSTFNGLKEGEFLFVGDQFFPFSLNEISSNSLFVKRLEYLGVHNGYQLVTQFWSSAYYKILYFLGFNFILAQRLEYFSVFFVSLTLSFLGFKYASKTMEVMVNKTFLVVLTVWYCINPYTLSLWHGGVYNLGSAFTYSLAPFILSSFVCYLQNKLAHWEKLLLIISVSVSFFTFWLFAPLGLLLFIVAFLCFFKSENKMQYVKRLVVLVGVFLITNLFVLFNIFFEQYDNKSSNNSQYTATFTNQLGGLNYQFKMLFSWGIYNVWHPRTLYPFGEFFSSQEYYDSLRILYVALMLILVLAIIKKPRRNIIITGVILLFIQFFLAKGPQAPLGEVFIFVYENIPFFSIFRTPDIRFGFTIVLIIAGLYFIAHNKKLSVIISTLLLIVISIQGKYFFDGSVHKGMNVPGKYVDRIISVPSDMQSAVNYLNSNSRTSNEEFVFYYPSYEYTHYFFTEEDSFIGQDIFSKLVDRPPVYLSQSKGIALTTYEQLNKIINVGGVSKLSMMPISYVIYRNDIQCDQCTNLLLEFEKELDKVYENNTYKIFHVNKSAPLVSDNQNNELEYSLIDPTLIKGRSSGGLREIETRLSFDKNWVLIYLDELIPKFKQAKQRSYYNYFDVSTTAESFKFIVFYYPQLIFYLALVINFGAFVYISLRFVQVSRRVKGK